MTILFHLVIALGIDVHAAALRGDVDAVRVALRAGAAIDDKSLERAWPTRVETTALFVAARDGHTEVVRVLLEAGADPDVRCIEEGTALTIAAASRSDRCEILALLIGAGADVRGPRPKGRSALGWAAMNGDYAAFKLLLDASRQCETTRSDELAVRAKLRYRNDDLRHTFDALLASDEYARPLTRAVRTGTLADVGRELARGVDASEADELGWTALHWAAGYGGSVSKVRALLAAQANPNAATKDGFTPLMAAAQRGDVACIEALLAAGADPNSIDVERRSALHVAAWRASTDAVRVLLDGGADLTLRNRWTQTAQDLARRRHENGTGDVSAAFAEHAELAWPQSADEIALTSDTAAPQLRITNAELSSAGSRTVLRATVWLYRTRTDIAFDAIWRGPHFAVPVGTVVAREGGVRGFQLTGSTDQAAPDDVEIVLEPSRELALDALKHTHAIFGERVVLRFATKKR